MQRYLLLGAASAIALVSLAEAATFTGTKGFSVSNQGLFGTASAPSVDDSFRVGPSGASIFASAFASAGTVSSSGSLFLSASFADELFASSGPFAVALSAAASAGFSTSLGAGFSAGVGTSFLGIGDINLIDEGYSLGTSASGATLLSDASDDDRQDFASAGIPEIPGLTLRASLSADAVQTSSLSLDDVSGTLVARNLDTGTILSRTFSLGGSAEDFLFDLAEVGTWSLSAEGLRVGNTFSSDFGIGVTGAVGTAIGFDCGDFSTDDDNGFFCGADAGVTIESEPLNLFDRVFSLAYGSLGSLALGEVVVNADPIPVPAGLPLMASALAAGAWFRRRAAERQRRAG